MTVGDSSRCYRHDDGHGNGGSSGYHPDSRIRHGFFPLLLSRRLTCFQAVHLRTHNWLVSALFRTTEDLLWIEKSVWFGIHANPDFCINPSFSCCKINDIYRQKGERQTMEIAYVFLLFFPLFVSSLLFSSIFLRKSCCMTFLYRLVAVISLCCLCCLLLIALSEKSIIASEWNMSKFSRQYRRAPAILLLLLQIIATWITPRCGAFTPSTTSGTSPHQLLDYSLHDALSCWKRAPQKRTIVRAFEKPNGEGSSQSFSSYVTPSGMTPAEYIALKKKEAAAGSLKNCSAWGPWFQQTKRPDGDWLQLQPHLWTTGFRANGVTSTRSSRRRLETMGRVLQSSVWPFALAWIIIDVVLAVFVGWKASPPSVRKVLLAVFTTAFRQQQLAWMMIWKRMWVAKVVTAIALTWPLGHYLEWASRRRLWTKRRTFGATVGAAFGALTLWSVLLVAVKS